MKISTSLLAMIVVVLQLAACSSDDNTESEASSDGIIPAHQLNTLKRAGDVEGNMLEIDKQRQQQLDQL